MSDNNLIPQANKVSLARRGLKALLPEAGWDAITTGFQLAGGASLLTGIYAALSHFFASSSLNIKLITYVFLASLLFIIIAFILGRVQRPGAKQSTEITPLQQRAVALAESGQAITEPCADKWLHDLADSQRKSIQSWVHLENVGFARYELLSEKPYIDFRFTVSSSSVFKVDINEVRGSASYANRLLVEQAIFIDTVEGLTLGRLDNCVIRQPLSREEATFVFNMGGHFEFRELKIKIEGGADVKPQDLYLERALSSEELYRAYPRLRIVIERAELKGRWTDVQATSDHWADDAKIIGSVINLKVHFENPRQRPVEIQSFRLDFYQPLTRRVPAEEGEIYELPHFNSQWGNKPLDNLNQRAVRAELGQPFDGWLQFILLGVEPEKLVGAAMNLVIVDSLGVEHGIGCPPLSRN